MRIADIAAVRRRSFLAVCLPALAACATSGPSVLQPDTPPSTASAAASPGPLDPGVVPVESDLVLHDFHFASGETLPELRLHYATLGTPVRDAAGHTTNAVLLLHATNDSSREFLGPDFARALFLPGQLLDVRKYFVILPDDIGHGRSSKPSDGLRARFPSYDYADMVAAEHRLVVEGLGVDRLRLLIGTSMGCMHTWMWAETWPDAIDAAMPLACYPVPIAGRNRFWRKLVIDGIRNDPAWKGGDYEVEPQAALRQAGAILNLVDAPALEMQARLSTRAAADAAAEEAIRGFVATHDANDLLYAVSASTDYDPSSGLGKITAALTLVNSGDDFINPPELAIAEREIQRVKRGKFVLLPTSPATRGHGTYSYPALWQTYLAALLEASAPRRPAEPHANE